MNQLAYKEKIRVLSYELEEKSNILEYRQKLINQAAQEKQELMTKLYNEIANQAKWNNSGKNLYKLIDSSMSIRTKRGLGLDKYSREGELGIDDSQFSIFHTNSDELEGQPIYNSDRSLEPSTNDLKMCYSSVESSRPNHSDHDSTSSVSTPASESRDTIVIDCDKQEDFPSVCSIETDVKSSKPLNAGGKGILGRRPIGKPVNPNRPELVFAGQQNPISAGPPNPVSAGPQNTVSAGQPNLVFAGPPNPVYAPQPNPVYAGDGILGQRPLNNQHTSTYFHSFTHNNQQILFLITHNSLYSLYMTGGLNGKTVVKPSAGWP
nr:hypothetical protein [Tanacetum cinerariifolium]